MKKSIVALLLISLLVSGCSSNEPRVFKSEELGVSFLMPESVSACEEKVEVKVNEKTSIDGFIANGSTVDIVCGEYDFVIEARSVDHNCYEACEYNQYPNLANDEVGVYKYKDFDVIVDSSYWGFGGEYFYVGTYFPLNNDKYDTFRVSYKLADVTFPDMVELGSINPDINILEYNTFIDKFIQNIVDGNSTDEINNKVKEFESILDSISIVTE